MALSTLQVQVSVFCVYTFVLFVIQDFPVQASEPKVQLPFYTKPGECPRKIEIERFVACSSILKL